MSLTSRSRRLGAALALLVALGGAGGVWAAGSARPAAPATADSVLDSLTVRGRAPLTGYSRDAFGPAWADVDHNGCDTRNDVLARQLANVKKLPAKKPCEVLSGTLTDPYTGKVIEFQRGACRAGQTTGCSNAVQIDHIVPLANAWVSGAGNPNYPPADREALANDPLNLQATDGPTNNAKRDGDAATWLPPNTQYRCAYVADQIYVKTKYKLSVTPAEKDAMRRVLASC